MFANLNGEPSDTPTCPRIALVDPEAKDSLVKVLTDAGYEVQCYSHPLKALEQIVDKPVKGAIVAHELPWMSGSALARTLRESYRVTNVVLMDKGMSDETILAKVRNATPVEDAPARPRTRTRKVVNSKATGRRILIRTARR